MWIEPAFSPGRVIVTQAAREALDEAGLSEDASVPLARHLGRDWGDLEDEGAMEANDRRADAPGSGAIRSRYRLRGGGVLLVTSDPARGVTVVSEEREWPASAADRESADRKCDDHG